MLEYYQKGFNCSWRVRGWVGGGPSNFIVNQSPNPWILGFEILDLDFGLDKRKNNQFFSHVGGGVTLHGNFHLFGGFLFTSPYIHQICHQNATENRNTFFVKNI